LCLLASFKSSRQGASIEPPPGPNEAELREKSSDARAPESWTAAAAPADHNLLQPCWCLLASFESSRQCASNELPPASNGAELREKRPVAASTVNRRQASVLAHRRTRCAPRAHAPPPMQSLEHGAKDATAIVHTCKKRENGRKKVAQYDLVTISDTFWCLGKLG